MYRLPSTRRLGVHILLSLTFFTTTLAKPQPGTLTTGQINVISARLAEAALEPWELGTRAQAILELNATDYSVFSSTKLPPPKTIPKNLARSGVLDPFFAIPRTLIQDRTAALAGTNPTTPQPFEPDGAAADPASMGMAVVLANWTGMDKGQLDYAGAARDEVEFLLTVVARTSDGAISHRSPELQLWSDFVYMVPPFLAYYGVITQNRSLVAEAYNQIKLYRGHLRDPTTGLWQHVTMGPFWNDPRFWSTGQGWAAAGMLRVYSTIHQSKYSSSFENEKRDLATWVGEIHAAVYPYLDDTGIFPNYPNLPITGPTTDNFYDAAGTTLIASTVYRAATVLNDRTHIHFADRSRLALFNTTAKPLKSDSDSALEGYAHFTTDGWLQPVVNPHSFNQFGEHSAEGQAFVVQLVSAYRDYLGGHSQW